MKHFGILLLVAAMGLLLFVGKCRETSPYSTGHLQGMSFGNMVGITD
jgi:hypothetical protein